MRGAARLLSLALAVGLATWVIGWLAVPVVAMAWGVISGRDTGPVEATIATLVAWLALLAVAALSGSAGIVARTLGGVVGVAAMVLPVVTLLFAVVLAWSAAVIGGELGRLGRRGRHAAALIVAITALEACDRPAIEGLPVDTVDVAAEVTIAGRYHPHPDFPQVRATCFSVDEESAARAGRSAGDDRLVWFCFENPEEAARSLGPPGTSGDATIVVVRHGTAHAAGDTTDLARLVRVVSRAPEGSIP